MENINLVSCSLIIHSAVKKATGMLFCVFLLGNSAFAQTPPTSKLSTIPDSLFAPGQFPAHPDVPFIYSLKKLHITFQEKGSSIIAVMHYHIRKKIFDASSKRAALVGIPYYFGNHIEKVVNIHGYTWQGPHKRVALDTKKIRTINLNSRYNVKEFTMPDVKDGSVIDYIYTIRRRYIEMLPAFYFSHQVPTKRAEVTITYPDYLRYKGMVQNYSGKVVHFVTKTDTSTHEPKVYNYPQPPPIVKETWRILDIPAVKKEKYISSLNNYRGSIKFQLSAFGIPPQPLVNSWDFVVAKIRQDQRILEHLKDDKKARNIGRQIAQALSRKGKKVVQDSIFNYLNQKAVYSGSKGPASKEKAETVLSGKPSSQAAINQALTAMLQGAGIQAWPLLISTRKAGQINRKFPSFFQFNSQLTYSKIDSNSYFMDASFPHSVPNLIPVSTYNVTGLLLEAKSYKWIPIQPSKSKFSIKVNIDAELKRNGDLSGTLQAKNVGYSAQKIRSKQASGVSTPQIIRQVLLNGYSQARLSDAALKKAGKDKANVVASSKFTLKHYAVPFKNGLQFRPMVVGYIRNNPFSDSTRKLPVTLDAPERLNLSYHIQLPAGMSLKKPPQDHTIRLPGAVLKEQYHINGRTLQYEFIINIYRKDFPADLYPRLLHFYEYWVHLSHEQWYGH
jgi:hypothetical protein